PLAAPLHEVDNEDGAGRPHSQPQHDVERHHQPRRLSQLFRHDLGAIDNDQSPQVAIAQPQQRREDHWVDVLVEDHCPDVSSGLVVAEDEEREEDGPEEDEDGQQLAFGAGHLDPGGDLPPTPVSKVVQEETGEWRKVLGAPQ
ncbi:hypothetical protein N340_02833, partial [Tauraco erythrolophus]